MNPEAVPPALGLVGAVCAASALVSWIALPVGRLWFVRCGWIDEPGGRKRHAGPIALAGGLAVFAGIATGIGLAFTAGGAGAGPTGITPSGSIWFWGIGTAAMLLLGWWDDIVELRAVPKLCGQLAVTTATVWSGARLPILEGQPLIQALASVVFLLAVLNAFNFLDNMNGLCAGLGLIAAASFLVIAHRQDQRDATIAATALAGACAGFLPWNYPKASAFLGDSGSHVIGYLAALLAIATCAGGFEPASTPSPRPWIPLIVLAVPIVDLVQVAAVRWFRGQPLHVGDANHLSHLLVRRGFRPAASVALLWLLAAIAGAIAAATSR